jgi:23S rRNA (uracil1939-C5)-methyltransferase
MIRDANVLADAGYKIAAAGVMDMFPHTSHIEAMALFEK